MANTLPRQRDYQRQGPLSGGPGRLRPQRFPRAQLSQALLGYYLAVVGLVTLVPFRFSATPVMRPVWPVDVPDAAANVVFFIPLGYLYMLTRRPGREVGIGGALAFGFVVSMGVETAQLFAEGRYASVFDVATNSVGACLGAWIQGLLVSRLGSEARLGRRLALDVPLMGSLYLLVPLLWLISISVGDDLVRVVLLTFVGLFGARLWAALGRHQIDALTGGRAGRSSLASGGWMLLGVIPAMGASPSALLASVAVVAAGGWYFAARAPSDVGPERRFELPALRDAAPYLAMYLVGTAVLELRGGGLSRGSPHLEITVDLLRTGTLEQLRFLEWVAALTLIGYMVAEARGRLELPFRGSLVPMIVSGGAAVLTVGAGRAFGSQAGVGVIDLFLMLIATLFGGWVYHLQRDLIWQRVRRAPALQARSNLDVMQPQ